MEDYFVKLISAEKTYGEVRAVKDISLGLYKGRTLGLLGSKGAGKSTLCRLLCGIERPSAGKILLEGRKIDKKAKTKIRYLLSDEDISRFKHTGDVMDFYETYYPDFSRKTAVDIMRLLGVDYDKKISKNKGENQLIALSCMAAGSAEFYVLDEPLTYFDRAERESYLKTVFRTFETKPLIVISTEFLRGIESLLDDAAFMDGGRIKLCKSAEEIRIKTNKGVEAFFKEVYGLDNQ